MAPIADKGTRFLNFIVDTVIFIIIVMAHVFVFNGLLRILTPGGSSVMRIYFLVLYFAYYFLFEYFIGRTPGKLATQTKVTNMDGGKPAPDELLVRNICRFIPLDNLSFLFGKRGWHDSISKTQVVYMDKPDKAT